MAVDVREDSLEIEDAWERRFRYVAVANCGEVHGVAVGELEHES